GLLTVGSRYDPANQHGTDDKRNQVPEAYAASEQQHQADENQDDRPTTRNQIGDSARQCTDGLQQPHHGGDNDQQRPHDTQPSGSHAAPLRCLNKSTTPINRSIPGASMSPRALWSTPVPCASTIM